MDTLSGWRECHYCKTVFPVNGFGFMSMFKHHWYCNKTCYRHELEEQQEERKLKEHANAARNVV